MRPASSRTVTRRSATGRPTVCSLPGRWCSHTIVAAPDSVSPYDRAIRAVGSRAASARSRSGEIGADATTTLRRSGSSSAVSSNSSTWVGVSLRRLTPSSRARAIAERNGASSSTTLVPW